MKALQKRLISFMLTLAMVISMLTGMSSTVLAGEANPYASLVNTTTVVHFDGKDWYLIENNSTAIDAGTVTLLTKECVGGSDYRTSDIGGPYDNTYAGSTVETFVNNYYRNKISNAAKAAVVDNGMFLLTEAQVNASSEDVMKCNQIGGIDGGVWWLVTPSTKYNGWVRCVSMSSGRTWTVLSNGERIYHDIAPRNTMGVRPALRVDLSKVTFDQATNTFSIHTHDWSYAADGATITATCSNEGCNVTEGLALTINAPTATTYDGNAKSAAISEGYSKDAFPGEIAIVYEKDGSAVDAADVNNVGTYTVKVTVGNATASVEFEIVEVDKTALNSVLTEAEEFYDTIKDNKDYEDIARGLKDAIDAAKEVKDNENVTSQEVSDATDALKDALDAAKAAVKEAEDLADAKEAAKAALKEKYDGMKDSGDYDEEGLDELKKAYEDAVSAIDATTVIDTKDEPKDNGPWKAEKAGEEALDAVKTKDEKDQEAADAVKKMIDELPNPNDVTIENKDEIEDARKAYDNLTDNQKDKLPVDSKDKLEQDEDALAQIELDKAKEEAKKELEEHRNSKDDSKYEPECVDELDEAKTAGDEAIDDATSLEEVKEALNNAKAAIDAVPTKIEYSAIEGRGSNWEKGSTSGDKFVFKRNVNDEKTYEEFNGVLVDGKAIKSTDYTAESGSVIITFKPEYLETLSVGEHTLTAMFTDGEDVTVPFTVSEKNSQPDNKKDEVKPSDDKKDETKPADDKKNETKPADQKKPAAKTGDENYMATYIMMFAAALLLAMALYTSKLYKRNHRI